MDRPIIMSGPMVQAIIAEIHEAGTGKQMTRRLATSPLRLVEVGDVLWVRESAWAYGYWKTAKKGGKIRYTFRRDWSTAVVYDEHSHRIDAIRRGRLEDRYANWHKRPSIFMVRSDSRIILTVTKVAVERLQSISEVDCEREGVARKLTDDGWLYARSHDERAVWRDDPRDAFRDLWVHLHGNESWDANPSVVAILFRPEMMRGVAAPAEAAL